MAILTAQIVPPFHHGSYTQEDSHSRRRGGCEVRLRCVLGRYNIYSKFDVFAASLSIPYFAEPEATIPSPQDLATHEQLATPLQIL